MAPLTYTDARTSLASSGWMDPVRVTDLTRRTICRAPDGLGYWHLNAQERSALLALVTRANSLGVALCVADEFAVAGVPRNALAPVLHSLEERGHIRVLNGPKGKRLFVVLTVEPYAKPEGWSPASLHRSLRNREREATPVIAPKPKRAPRPKRDDQTERQELHARLMALANAERVAWALKQAKDARGGKRLAIGTVRTVIDAVERAERDCRPAAVAHAVQVTNERTLADGRPMAVEPKRWAGYVKAVARSTDEEILRGRFRPASAVAPVAPIADVEVKARRADEKVRELMGAARDLNKAGDPDAAGAVLAEALAMAPALTALSELAELDAPEAEARERIALAWRIGTTDWLAAPTLPAIYDFPLPEAVAA